MSDFFQVVVDRDVLPNEAAALAETIRDWLIQEAIIQPELTNCVLSGLGYKPGDNYHNALKQDETHQVERLQVNGLEIVIGRTVFHAGQDETVVSCPHCQAVLQDTIWLDAITAWYDSKSCTIACPNCENSLPVTEWTFDPPWGFGHLGFQFWNWEPLSESFIAQIADRLGHRVTYVYGKL